MSVMTGTPPLQQFGQQIGSPQMGGPQQQLAQVVQQAIQQACQQASQQIAQRVQQTLQQIQQVQQQLQQQGLAHQAHPYLAVALHTTLTQGVRSAVEQSVQQALPTAILTLVQQSQAGQQGLQGQQPWGGGFGQQSFGQPYPQQHQQPGVGFGQVGQPFGIG
ncbi:hypothetical protein ACFXMT_29540 [Streptomyces mirabilis]|uniref:hypothetical protein n=1 Tax=Streptomyces mirabilis TaxID=68239 RepID=UPI0036893603